MGPEVKIRVGWQSVCATGWHTTASVFPARVRPGNYVPSVIPRRYDAFLHIEESHALHPLHVPVQVDGEEPDTYPTGM